MFSFFFTSFCLIMMIIKIQSIKVSSSMELILINSTSTQCDFNKSTSTKQDINLCLDDTYSYECHNNHSSSNISLTCALSNNDTACHSDFFTYSSINITLDCFYRHLNTTLIGDQFHLKHVNECMYGVAANHNNTLLVCAIFHPLITVTTFNSTAIYEQSSKYYKFPLFGFEVNKNLVKHYGILIIVAIIVVSCLIACLCYGMCNLCCSSMKTKNNNRNMNSNENQRMPQSNSVNI